MSGAIMNKVLDLFGVDTAEEDYEDEVYDEEIEQEDDIEENRNFWNRRSNKVVNMPQTNQIRMVISQPTTFEQSEDQ